MLIQISVCGVSAELRRILANHEIWKVGVAASGDARKLKEDYGIIVNGVVDLEAIVGIKDLSNHVDPSIEYSKTENSLAGRCSVLVELWHKNFDQGCARDC